MPRQLVEVEIPLTAAAQRAGLSYQQARDAILQGRLTGELKFGRWIVRVDEALEQLIRERAERPRRPQGRNIVRGNRLDTKNPDEKPVNSAAEPQPA